MDRIVVCWLALDYAETVYYQSMGDVSRPWAEFHRQRIDRTHRRYVAAIEALAQVRPLLVPNVQVNIAEKQINVVD